MNDPATLANLDQIRAWLRDSGSPLADLGDTELAEAIRGGFDAMARTVAKAVDAIRKAAPAAIRAYRAGWTAPQEN